MTPQPIPPADLRFDAVRDVLAAEHRSVTVYLPEDVGDALLAKQGWTVEPARGGGNAYVMPGRTPRSEGGKFGDDYLWDREEAITRAIIAEVLR